MRTRALADFVGSALLTAVTLTVAGAGTVAGATYEPAADIVPNFALPPTLPLICHVTPPFELFWTDAVNCRAVRTRTVAVVREMTMRMAVGGGGVVVDGGVDTPA